MLPSAHKMLKIAKVLKSNGTEGEVVISLYGIALEDIDIREPVFIYFDGLPVPFYFESVTGKGNNKALVRMTGIGSLEDADEISGADIFADSDSIDIADDEDFSFLTGWTLTDENDTVMGKISGFLDIPENPCLEIAADKGEVLVPLHENLIESIDERNSILKMKIPAGLFA